jgi:hypothetical protein
MLTKQSPSRRQGEVSAQAPGHGPVAARNMAAAAGRLEAGDNRIVWVAALTKLIALHKAGVRAYGSH